jgi:hypothetical protein
MEGRLDMKLWAIGLTRRKRQDLGPGLAEALEAAK